MVKVTSSAGTKFIQMLPDSGADISAAGQELLHHLGYHVDNLLPSGISPRTMNGTTMIPLGKISVTLQLGNRSCKDDLHVYPGMSGALILWKIARKLAILPANYPYLIETRDTEATPQVKVTKTGQGEARQLMDKLVQEFPEVFNGQVTTMKGEKFTISLTDNAVPFCVKAPRTIPFAYREKQKLQSGVLLLW